jgi:hypothetical protein
VRYSVLVIVAIILLQCARQTQPAGGPKDVAPPVLISSNPEDGQRNYKGHTIELIFDEDIKLKDPKEEILITPSPGAKTKFVAKKKRVIITPEKKWTDSTTYSIAFRDGIQDLNESNPAENLHLAFSTGRTIDSLEINGTINEAFQEKIPDKITIALYQSDTFDIFKHKPMYFTKANKKGQFTIRNLKPGQYHVYAFDDKNKNQKVDSKSERFGYISTPFTLPAQTDTLHLQIVHADSRPIKITSVRNSSSISTIRFNKPIDSLKITSPKSPIIYTFGDSRSEVTVYKNFDPKDSIEVKVFATDSIKQSTDTTTTIKYSENKSIAEKFKVQDWAAKLNLPTNTLHANTTINKLLSTITYDSIYIQLDSNTFQTIRPEEITQDTLHKTITIKTKIKDDVKHKELNPVLLFGRGALISINSDSSKSQDIKIQIPKPEELGTLSIEVNTKEPNYILQLLTSDNKIVESIQNLKKYTFSNLTPGEFKILVIIDTNHNRRWDAGNYHRRLEAEKTLFYKTLENKYTIPIRANWEVGPLLITF